MVVKSDTETRNIDVDAGKKMNNFLLFLMILPALLSSRGSLQHSTFREDLHFKATLVFCSLLLLETRYKITS
ncbi:voltage-dependent L-type calcium channel subunit alpha-1C-like isoform 9 [Corchorus olitorius]|uniref:Voltage-dependent L-type calcium channel subunit alpha-1C-like isoform 9 n=1 Tax=Corchorus olitorius TaxID=93759 RepID=A0A1R3GZI6_9ROSI|nr:voltage-dependent L-type calcium channel subunit alpha-1C-like isoform 9 [Corchorus olitorius]